MRTIAGVVPAAAGGVSFQGNDLRDTPPDKRAAAGISLCPEGRGILATLSVERNLLVGATPLRRRLGPKHAREQIAAGLERAFTLFPILYERRDSLGGELSGGQQQMLAIARALMSAPKLLMLDEPSLGLAPKIVSEVYELLHGLKAELQTLIVVEESAERALHLADRAYVLRTGREHLQGPARDVRTHPELRAAYLGDSEEVSLQV
jgi:branched-chain amino acid transport system ATP-binding protein